MQYFKIYIIIITYIIVINTLEHSNILDKITDNNNEEKVLKYI